MQSDDGKLLEGFQNLPIRTDILNVHDVPGKIEAEEFVTNEGWIMENCTDEGTGFDMGYTDDGDYLDYLIDVTENGRYQISYRVASGNSSGGKIDLELVSNENEETKLHSIGVPYTNGWQNWITISREINLSKGEHTLRVLVNSREFNLNWVNLELLEITASTYHSTEGDFFNIYPNPATSKLYIDFIKTSSSDYSIHLINIHGSVLKSKTSHAPKQAIFNLDGLNPGFYILQIIGQEKSRSKSFIISN